MPARKSTSILHHALALVGFLSLSSLFLKETYKLLKAFRVHILSRWWRKNLREYGEWAVVTGATDGIGKAYAEELARRGLNVVLISRTLQKLQKVAKDIEHQTQRKTRIIQADFTGGLEIYPKIEEGLKDLEIGILVNNVATMYNTEATPFLSFPDLAKMLADGVNCNMLSIFQMTRIVLPGMLRRRKGLIINMSSEAGARPFPYTTAYSSTKGFVDYFSRALHGECHRRGVNVQCVMPLLVSTNLIDNKKVSAFVKRADDFAREALNTAGLTNRTSGCIAHSFQSYLIDKFMTDTILRSRFMVPQNVLEQEKLEEANKPKNLKQS